MAKSKKEETLRLIDELSREIANLFETVSDELKKCKEACGEER